MFYIFRMRATLPLLLIAIIGFAGFSPVSLQNANAQVNAKVVYQGTSGPGLGKHLVFLAGDHEYRSEESLPALARILAKHHGFKCTVLFSVNRDTGEIEPGSSFMPGLEVLESADLMVIFLRFQNFPDAQMQHIDRYLKRGGPVLGMRTSTHAFKMPQNATYARYSYRSTVKGWEGGFGRKILGETWAGHYGKNHVMSTRLDIAPDAKSHPILRGVEKPWVQAGGYWTEPKPDCKILAYAQPLQAMTPDSPAAPDKKPCPGAWIRYYESESGRKAPVFTTTYGASEDILNDDFRRMLINACFWAAGLEKEITPNKCISFVGPYHPVTFSFGGYRKQVKPEDLAGWNTPIMSPKKSTAPLK